jgi:hypothetical protein
MKLPGHRPGLPGNVISFYIVPLDPAYKAGLSGHSPAKRMLFIMFDDPPSCQITTFHRNLMEKLLY